jgi:hypothetical protein
LRQPAWWTHSSHIQVKWLSSWSRKLSHSWCTLSSLTSFLMCMDRNKGQSTWFGVSTELLCVIFKWVTNKVPARSSCNSRKMTWSCSTLPTHLRKRNNVCEKTTNKYPKCASSITVSRVGWFSHHAQSTAL